MHNCTVVNYSIKGELVNRANSTNYKYQPVDCSRIARQVGTHTRRAIWQLSKGCKLQEPNWQEGVEGPRGRMVKRGSSRQGAQQDGVADTRCAGVLLVADCVSLLASLPIYTPPHWAKSSSEPV